MAVLFFVFCFKHKGQTLKILAYSCRQDFPDLENKENKLLDVDSRTVGSIWSKKCLYHLVHIDGRHCETADRENPKSINTQRVTATANNQQV